MKTYILYHANCPDGFTAATVAHKVFGKYATYIPVNYNEPVPEMKLESEVFILDFSYPRDILRTMANNHKRIIVLDHHASAMRDLASFSLPNSHTIRFDMSKSGAMLAWEYFFPNQSAPDLVKYVQDRDLWKWELPASREISAAMNSYDFHFDTYKLWMEDSKAMSNLAYEGESCLRLKNQQVEIMAKRAQWMRFCNGNIYRIVSTSERDLQIDAPTANATVFFSEVGEKMLELHREALFAAYYFDRGNVRQWGLRSRPEFDCSLLAKQYGGGGHKQASGFTQPIED